MEKTFLQQLSEKSGIKALIFDLDGTLVDSKKANFLAYQTACRNFGIELTEEKYNKTFGLSSKKAIAFFANTCNEKLILNIHKTKIGLFDDFLKKIKIIKGTSKLLEEARGKYKIALATSASRASANKVLDYLGIKNYFDIILCSDDVKNTKPAPDMFLKAAKLLKTKKEECLVFEDSDHGIEAAKRAGMEYIKVQNA